MLKTSWQTFEVSPDETHHLVDGAPAYDARFLSVLKFHAPGLAPVLDASGAYHIDAEGRAAYSHRFIRTFGFYDGRAAVESKTGWYHILTDGSQLYPENYLWCGNFQQNYCCVKDHEGRFFHIDRDGKRAYSRSFKYAGDFRDGYASVQDDLGLYTHIDFSGRELHGQKFLDLDVFHKRFALAKDGKGWVHINLQGLPAYQNRYKNIEPFYNGVARVETHSGALHLINERGQLLSALRDPIEDEFHQVSAELVSYWKYYTIDAACTLKLFDHLPGSTKLVSQQISLPYNSTEKLLKALCDMGFIQKSSEEEWTLSTKGEFLTSKHPFSLLAAQQLWKDEHLESWRHLLYSLKSETPAFNHLYGKSWFDYLQGKNEKNELYHKALSTYAKRDYKMVSSRIDFRQHQTAVDIGGSSGTLMFELLTAHPHLRGMIVDLPNVTALIKIPDAFIGRLELIPTDFFDQWPAFKADCALLSRVLHDWSDERCIEILKKIHSVLPDSSSRLYIIENICGGSLLDLNMLVMTEGKERPLSGFEKILNESGFILESTCPLNEVSTILIARKK